MAAARPTYPIEFKRELSPQEVLAGFKAARAIPIIRLAEGFIDGDEKKTDLFYARRPFSKPETAELVEWFKQNYPSVCVEEKAIAEFAMETLPARALIVLGILLEEEADFKIKMQPAEFYYKSAFAKQDPIAVYHMVEYHVVLLEWSNRFHGEARTYFEEVIKAGCKYGYWGLYQILKFVDSKEYLKCVEEAAKRGIAKAQCSLANQFWDDYVPSSKSMEDLQFAKQLYAAAAIQGSADGLRNYAVLIKKQDHELSCHLRRLAIETGYRDKNGNSDWWMEYDSNSPFTYHHYMFSTSHYRFDTQRRKESEMFTNLCLRNPELVDRLACEYGDSVESVFSIVEKDKRAELLQEREDFFGKLIHIFYPSLPAAPAIEIVLSYSFLFGAVLQSGFASKELTAKARVERALQNDGYRGLNLFAENARLAAEGKMSYVKVEREAYKPTPSSVIKHLL